MSKTVRSKPITVTLSCSVSTEVAFAFARRVEDTYKGRKSKAMEALLRKALNPLDLGSLTDEELKRLSVEVNGELILRTKKQEAKKQP